MRRRITCLSIVALLVCAVFAIPAAYAEGTCQLGTLGGTYVTSERGWSLQIDLSSQPAPPFWVVPVMAPFVNIGKVTFTSDGVGDGYFWMWAGSISAAVEPTPVHMTVSELNEDCTGKFSYTLPNGATIEERFIIIDNGREFRSVPTVSGMPALAWIGEGHRISNGNTPADACGQQTAHGSYVMTCDNIVRAPLNPMVGVADALLLRMDVSMAGDYTGTLYEKLGLAKIELPVSGTMAVNPDCSFTGTLAVPTLPGAIVEKGLFFNEGKEFYAMGILNPSRAEQNIKYSLCRGTRIGQ
jgi:hypothetical protein